MSDYLNTCQRAARAGGMVLLDWVGRFAAREKAQSDLVTEADIASQEQTEFQNPSNSISQQDIVLESL